ncbi:hypothetical protein [Bradyrhizobium icense]|uniref:Uncharacterized protein n=1 Tax=Bradyrhizobium icense TaxID=1274631 RepID=A0A1B1UJ61_9BRAD|nr:hypothetical protein [Bradyrhizobium icense]ANW02737.1 hypothetical protein LMTR13_23795 [Bradyrhizobium icense]
MTDDYEVLSQDVMRSVDLHRVSSIPGVRLPAKYLHPAALLRLRLLSSLPDEESVAPWLAVARDHGLAPEYLAHLETLSSFAALATASYWYSIVVAKAALGLREQMMVETSKT